MITLKDDPLVALMREIGVPITRQDWIDIAYGREVPVELQDWSQVEVVDSPLRGARPKKARE